MIRVLHSSDWHLGRNIGRLNRRSEYQCFLDWLLETVEKEQVDALIVAGDIFDTGTPSNEATALYYKFLAALSQTCCKQVVITAGNHDSPSFLAAPQSVLSALGVHVVCAVGESHEENVFLLKNAEGLPAAAVCAVPYLRASDVQSAEVWESDDAASRRYMLGIQSHYRALVDAAQKAYPHLPLIATGHLFVSGAQLNEGTHFKEVRVGTLADVGVDIFPEELDYVALGHIHIPQSEGKRDHWCYSGAPIPMNFGEAEQSKSVCIVELNGKTKETQVRLISVPQQRMLASISGDKKSLEAQVQAWIVRDVLCSLELTYESIDSFREVKESLQTQVEGTKVDLAGGMSMMSNGVGSTGLSQADEVCGLAHLTKEHVFERVLEQHELSEEERVPLREAFASILAEVEGGAL